LSPQDVKAMSIWEYFAVLSGQVEGDGLSAAETDEIWDWLQSKQ
jgi:hypothetical protein